MQSHFHWQKFFGAATDTIRKHGNLYGVCDTIVSIYSAIKGHQKCIDFKKYKEKIYWTPTISLTM